MTATNADDLANEVTIINDFITSEAAFGLDDGLVAPNLGVAVSIVGMVISISMNVEIGIECATMAIAIEQAVSEGLQASLVMVMTAKIGWYARFDYCYCCCCAVLVGGCPCC